MVPGCSQSGPGVVPEWSQGVHGVVPKWSRGGPSVVPGWSQSRPRDAIERSLERINGLSKNLKKRADGYTEAHHNVKSSSRSKIHWKTTEIWRDSKIKQEGVLAKGSPPLPDRLASPSTYPVRWVGQWVMFSGLGDS